MGFFIPTKGKVKTTASSTRTAPVNFTPIAASNNEVNVLTPTGPATESVPTLAPDARRLDSSGTASLRPTPVGKP